MSMTRWRPLRVGLLTMSDTRLQNCRRNLLSGLPWGIRHPLGSDHRSNQRRIPEEAVEVYGDCSQRRGGSLETMVNGDHEPKTVLQNVMMAQPTVFAATTVRHRRELPQRQLRSEVQGPVQSW